MPPRPLKDDRRPTREEFVRPDLATGTLRTPDDRRTAVLPVLFVGQLHRHLAGDDHGTTRHSLYKFGYESSLRSMVLLSRQLQEEFAGGNLDLWQMARPAPPAPREPPATARIARWLIGALPRHQETRIPEETAMLQSVYRSNEPELAEAPVVRDPLRVRVERIRKEYLDVISTVERVVIGKRDVVERALTAMAARGHVLLMDVPGVGKTQLCKAIAAAVGVRFGRVQFTPDLLPMDLTGATIYEAQSKQFVFRPGPVFTNILLADEINRATPKTQSALLEVMEERTVTVDGTTHPMAEPFQVLATMNPLDHEGTFALPAAQIDRFMLMVKVGYPSREEERAIMDRQTAVSPASVSPKVTPEQILAARKVIPEIYVDDKLKDYIISLVFATRDPQKAGLKELDAMIRYGASPRATMARAGTSPTASIATGVCCCRCRTAVNSAAPRPRPTCGWSETAVSAPAASAARWGRAAMPSGCRTATPSPRSTASTSRWPQCPSRPPR